MIRALEVFTEDDASHVRLVERTSQEPRDGEIVVDVMFSSMNYKDALAVTGAAPIIRSFPLVPGIDAVGRVRTSKNDDVHVGETVILTGRSLGVSHDGGMAEQVCCPGDWAVPLPEGLDPEDAMALGTAGLAAAQCVLGLLETGLTPDDGEVLVTGAAGGVGSIAVALLAARGFDVVASTRRVHESEYLLGIGASRVIDAADLSTPSPALSSQQWAGAVDSVGGHTVAHVLSGMRYGATVTCCGLAQSIDLPGSLAPFILRAVTLRGIDTVQATTPVRTAAWALMAQTFSTTAGRALLRSMTTTIPLDKVADHAPLFLEGKVRGRIVVDVRS